VVTDREGYALYFSRASIPWDRDRFAANREQIGDHYQRHIGIYAYRAGFIQRYVDWAPSVLEQVEALEQLRVLWYGRRSTWPRRCEARRWGWTPRPISTRCVRCWRLRLAERL
jgi:3-deoxy-D-manno-octulosonate cytidylyltransferase